MRTVGFVVACICLVCAMSGKVRGDVWAVGDNGTIIHSAGPGSPWAAQSSGTSAVLYDACFLDANNGWVSGYGVVLHTTNGGANWSVQAVGSGGYAFRDVSFTDPLHGWLNGGSNGVYKTVNGGQTWSLVPVQGMSGFSSGTGIQFFDASHGWAAFFGQPLMQTSDGGATWTARSASELFQSMDAVDANHIWAGYGNTLIHTTDGGSTWQTLASGFGTAYDLSFVDDRDGWVDGSSWWQVASTSDAGAHWTNENTGVFYGITAMELADIGHGWVFTSHGNIAYTANGGQSFTSQVSPTGQYIEGATVSPVPEPAALAIVVLGSLAGLRRRRGVPRG